MIKHVYHDGSFGIEYEVGDLVRRTIKGLLSPVGQWGRVYRVEPFSDKSRPGWWYTAMLHIALAGYSCRETDIISGTSDGVSSFEPFETPEANIFWEQLTDKDRVLDLRRPGGGGVYLAVRPDGAEGVVCWSGRDALRAQRWLTQRAKRIDVPSVTSVYPFVDEVMAS